MTPPKEYPTHPRLVYPWLSDQLNLFLMWQSDCFILLLMISGLFTGARCHCYTRESQEYTTTLQPNLELSALCIYCTATQNSIITLLWLEQSYAGRIPEQVKAWEVGNIWLLLHIHKCVRDFRYREQQRISSCHQGKGTIFNSQHVVLDIGYLYCLES